ncbi:hypothetical protein PVAR5_1761 [Paecilomyces variotii No. 5]|uniref:Glutathione S-transferase n=1 Tax=Byssochlamys spectabilis (strain No. 5 / NBRC 109023) TaxID=1356009 RepID=V5HU86_BYSSN|nr:hypothetical protein PVAR5_1761 [Paecilomyces variotii No. 5]
MPNPSSLPVYYYFSLGRLGRGEVLNLFLKDAGIEYKEVRYAYDHTFPPISEGLQNQGITRTGKLPALEYNGHVFTQHIPTLRYLARELGSYDGETNRERYLVDAVSDIYIDWRFHWVNQLKGVTKEYKDDFIPKYYNVISQYYTDVDGPYLLGNKITYADFAVYQSIDNDKRIGTAPSALPSALEKLVEAIEARPNIAAYLKENKAAGVIGLSTALQIQQYLTPSQSIVIVASEFPNTTSINYTSPWAGAHYRPCPGASPQAIREADQCRRTYDMFKRIAVEEPAAGIKFIEGIEQLEAPPPEYLDATSRTNAYGHLEKYHELSKDELPEGVRWGARYFTWCLNSPVYCAHLLRKFILKGGQTREYALANLLEAFELASNVKTVVNCSGTGFNDPKSFIIRGQTCLVRNPCSVTLTRQQADGSWSFCIPRPLDGGTVIGGTKQPHNWDPNPSPETRAQLLANASKWFPFSPESGGKFDVIRDIVGRRPAREGGMRIEVERVGKGSNRTVVHAYGAGGRGYELSWGVAEDVTQLMLQNRLLHTRASL